MKIRAAAVAAIAATAAVLSACVPPPVPPPGWDQVYLTRDGADETKIQRLADGRVHVSAPRSNKASNSRAFFWEKSSPVTRDHYSCATVGHSGLPVQEGVVLRIAASPGGGTRGISVQKNIIYNVNWKYNVHLFDTANPDLAAGRDFAQLGAVDFAAVVSEANRAGQPLRLCAKATGRSLEMKLWPAGSPEPAWGDPHYTRTMTLPAAWVYQGRPGYYIGHVPPGGHANFTHLHRGAP